MELFDTHCHIDLDVFDDDRDAMLHRAREAGVASMVVVGFSPERWDSAARLAADDRGIWLSVGLHPNESKQFDPSTIDRIRDTARKYDAIAIGEVGLDYYWGAAPKELQQEAFAAQIDLAKDLELPFIVHQRDAERDVLDVLRATRPPHQGIMHCFTGDWDYASEVLDLGMHVGLGGAVTFKSRHELHDAAKRIPLDRIVLETDSPFMAPVPHRGERNEPTYVRLVAERLAELRGVSIEEVATATSVNARQLFDLAPLGAGRYKDSSHA
jgi:TatD DNase family protein